MIISTIALIIDSATLEKLQELLSKSKIRII